MELANYYESLGERFSSLKSAPAWSIIGAMLYSSCLARSHHDVQVVQPQQTEKNWRSLQESSPRTYRGVRRTGDAATAKRRCIRKIVSSSLTTLGDIQLTGHRLAVLGSYMRACLDRPSSMYLIPCKGQRRPSVRYINTKVQRRRQRQPRVAPPPPRVRLSRQDRARVAFQCLVLSQFGNGASGQCPTENLIGRHP